MWIRDDWDVMDEEKQHRTVTITLNEYRALQRESAGHDSEVAKKDKEIYELRRKVESLTKALAKAREVVTPEDDGWEE